MRRDLGTSQCIFVTTVLSEPLPDFDDEIKSWEVFVRLALTLLVAGVFANDHDISVTTDDLALVTDFLNAWLDLHDFLPCSLSSCECPWHKPLLSSNRYL